MPDSIRGFKVGDEVKQYDYGSLANLPKGARKNWAEYSEYPLGTKVGLMENKRWSSSGALSDASGSPTLYASGYIPIDEDTTITLEGLNLTKDSPRYGNTYFWFYNSSLNTLSGYSGSYMDGDQHAGYEIEYENGIVHKIKYTGSQASNVAYVAVSASLIDGTQVEDVSIQTDYSDEINYFTFEHIAEQLSSRIDTGLQTVNEKISEIESINRKKKNWAKYSENPLGTRIGILEQKRLNSSGVMVDSTGNPMTCATGYIPFKKGDTVTFEGLNLSKDSPRYGNTYIFLYTDSLGVTVTFGGSGMDGTQPSGWEVTYDEGTVRTAKYTGAKTDVVYLAVSSALTGEVADVVITTDSTDDINYTSISEDIDDLKTDINELHNQIADVEESINDNTIVVPSYWETDVSDAVTTVKNLQKDAGYAGVCFTYFSDAHVWHTNPHDQNIGILSAALMQQLNIPFTILTGDGYTNAAAATREIAQQCIDKLQEILSAVPAERLLYVKGNHEFHYGNEVIDGTQQYYFRSLSMGEEWENLNRRQSVDFRRVMGHDGTYFYIDNVPQKTRFLCLNNYRTDFTVDANGIPTCDAFHDGKGYGQEQLNFLIDALQSLETGWSIAFFMHCPPGYQEARDSTFFNGILTAFCNRSTFTNSYTDPNYTWASSSINVDFSNAQGTAIAVFCGHIHRDSIDTTTLPIPIITITCATNSSYNSENENPSTRTINTNTETALDVVLINKKTKVIYLTRLGVTTNNIHNSSKIRSVSYA